MSEAPKPAVTVLSGFSRDAVQATARALLIADENLIAISHDLTDIHHGRVTRTVRSLSQLLEHGPERAATLERVTVELVHGCVSCTLREDVLPTLVRLARTYPGRDLLLVLPPAIEPETVAAACARCTVGGEPLTEIVHFDSYLTVVDADRFLGDLTSSDDLRDRNLHAAGDDHRSVADVVTHQVEFSDTIVLWSRPGTDPSALDHLGALLHHLAPWSVLVPTGTTHSIDCTGLSTLTRHTARHDPSRPGILGRALSGWPISARPLSGRPVSEGLPDRPVAAQPPGPVHPHGPAVSDPAHGIASTVFESRRPFHPQRLHRALDGLTGDTLRGRGHLWIASQPDTVISFESTGGSIHMGNLGRWLAAVPTSRWTETSIHRRITADVTWDPYYGDRRTVLALIVSGPAVRSVTALLTGCLLTDAELSTGFDTWPSFPDPFAGCFPLISTPM